MSARITVTHIGGPTALIEIGSLRLVTDPTFDPAGTRYDVGFEIMTKHSGPSIAPEVLGRVDAVLLSHDHHLDNLDPSGREYLPNAGVVLTTISGAERLGANAQGLANWQSTILTGSQGERVKVTALPAKHGPEQVKDFIGDTIGFLVETDGRTLYISGDTIYFEDLEEIARRFPVDLALIYFGAAHSDALGDFTMTFTAEEGARMTQLLGRPTVVPIHYEGWAHFSQHRPDIEQAFSKVGLSEQLVFLPFGEARTF